MSVCCTSNSECLCAVPVIVSEYNKRRIISFVDSLLWFTFGMVNS